MLLDHFHAPLSDSRHWESFHAHWAGTTAAVLNSFLPSGWFAEPNVHYGIEIDVATFEASGVVAEALQREGSESESSGNSIWNPPAPQLTIEFPPTTDIIEMRVFRDLGGTILAGAVEFVSPANKDRPENREAFVSKCETYLREGVGLLVVDLVTKRNSNLHSELLARCGEPTLNNQATIYTSAYHVEQRDGQPRLDVWYEELEIGKELPVMPLFLRDGPCVQIDLPQTYVRTCRDLRIPLTSKS